MAEERFNYRVTIEHYLLGGGAAYLHIEGPDGWIEVDVEVLYSLLKHGGDVAGAIAAPRTSAAPPSTEYATLLRS